MYQNDLKTSKIYYFKIKKKFKFFLKHFLKALWHFNQEKATGKSKPTHCPCTLIYTVSLKYSFLLI